MQAGSNTPGGGAGGGRPVALVTGSGRGIGRGIAFALAEAGFDIVVHDLADGDDPRATLEGVAQRGGQARAVFGDVADLDAQEAMVASAWDAFGRIHCLVNNAGVSVLSRGDLLDVGVESYDRCLDINLRGAFFLIQKIAKRMLAAGDDGLPRSIHMITSVNASVASLNRGEYCISKAGGAMMAKVFALRLAPHGIPVFEIRPGIIRTDMTVPSTALYDKLIEEGISPIARWGEPADIGRAIATLAEGGIPFTAGQPIVVDGGLSIHSL